MIELPEAISLAAQLKHELSGAVITDVLPPTKPHKFCFFNGEPTLYAEHMSGAKILSASAFGMYVELALDNGMYLTLNDGINIRLVTAAPKDYQLYIALSDGRGLAFTVAMYGFINLHDGDYSDEYYQKSRNFLSPFAEGFDPHFLTLLPESKQNLSAKAFLATEQRFPGLGNGVLQDILFKAKINPKRKISAFAESDKYALLDSVKTVLRDMTDKGGRDTEKDIYGKNGGYATRLSKNTLHFGCPVCGGAITKEAYLGGSVYFCPVCQPLIK